jgi:hypothetical protein
MKFVFASLGILQKKALACAIADFPLSPIATGISAGIASTAATANSRRPRRTKEEAKGV